MYLTVANPGADDGGVEQSGKLNEGLCLTAKSIILKESLI